jgi:hypothetical protein
MFVVQRRFRLCVLLLVFCQLPWHTAVYGKPSAASYAVTLGWSPSPDTNVTGYLVLFGTASGIYTSQLDVGHTNSATVKELATNLTYYFRVMAYGSSGQESPPSNEITSTAPLNSPPVLSNLPPATASYQCYTDVPPAPTVTAASNCGGPLVVNYAQTESRPGLSSSNAITRTWTARDSCGNVATFTQTTTVNDTQPPRLTQGAIASSYPNRVAAEAAAIAATTASDNCTPAAQLATSAISVGTWNATVTVRVTDSGGNLASVDYLTRIEMPPPVIQTVQQIGSSLILTWSAIEGQTYQVESASDLNQRLWANSGDFIIATGITAATSVSMGPDPQRFYRVVCLP